jgi:hypothetical protein
MKCQCGNDIEKDREEFLTSMGWNLTCFNCAKQERTLIGAYVKGGGGNVGIHQVFLESDGKISGSHPFQRKWQSSVSKPRLSCMTVRRK